MTNPNVIKIPLNPTPEELTRIIGLAALAFASHDDFKDKPNEHMLLIESYVEGVRWGMKLSKVLKGNHP